MYPILRKNSEPISRINLLGSVFLTVQFVGGAYVDYLIGVDSVDQRIGEKAAAEWDHISQELFGGAEAVGLFDLGDFGVDFLGTACSYYNIANKCLIDGEYPVAFDTSTDSFRFPEHATYLDALLAILRPMSSVNEEQFVTVPTEETIALLIVRMRFGRIFSILNPTGLLGRAERFITFPKTAMTETTV